MSARVPGALRDGASGALKTAGAREVSAQGGEQAVHEQPPHAMHGLRKAGQDFIISRQLGVRACVLAARC
jgi:hypothetical protein